ncbi:MAG: DUF308 domain-containing protein [Candidatus Scatovivens sp.]
MDINKILKRERWMDIIISIILAIIGIVLIAKPENTLNAIAVTLGSIVIIYGLYKILKFFIKKESFEEEIYGNGLVTGIMIIIFGLILFMYIGIIESLLRITIGIWMVYNGLIKIFESKVFKDLNSTLWLCLVISSIVSIVLGLYITFYSGALIKILGVLILIYSLIDIVQTIIYNNKEKKIL